MEELTYADRMGLLEVQMTVLEARQEMLSHKMDLRERRIPVKHQRPAYNYRGISRSLQEVVNLALPLNQIQTQMQTIEDAMAPVRIQNQMQTVEDAMAPMLRIQRMMNNPALFGRF